jgi:hypothetical protein
MMAKRVEPIFTLLYILREIPIQGVPTDLVMPSVPHAETPTHVRHRYSIQYRGGGEPQYEGYPIAEHRYGEVIP